jgi:hypothetical protein
MPTTLAELMKIAGGAGIVLSDVMSNPYQTASNIYQSLPRNSEVKRHRTKLNPEEEKSFQSWYKLWATEAGLNLNPDSPLHKYDYRGAYKAGVNPEISNEDNKYHWDSRFKDPDHPNRFVNGIDTITGQPMK